MENIQGNGGNTGTDQNYALGDLSALTAFSYLLIIVFMGEHYGSNIQHDLHELLDAD